MRKLVHQEGQQEIQFNLFLLLALNLHMLIYVSPFNTVAGRRRRAGEFTTSQTYIIDEQLL